MGDHLFSAIATDVKQTFYQQNFSNDGTRFVAWYLRRVLRRSQSATRDDITDGQNDKQIDALVIDDDERRVLVIQGKFLAGGQVDGEPLREVLAAWARLSDLPSLQHDANPRLASKLEAVRQALDDDYEVQFELLTTGEITVAARADMKAFADRLESSNDFPATFQLVDAETLQHRLAEADALELPLLNHEMVVDPNATLVTDINGSVTVLTALPLTECLRLPGIKDGQLFRKNVRQSLGGSNKVNRGLRQTIRGEHVDDFFFYHNGITALCDSVEISSDRKQIAITGLSVVNGCQSLTTIYGESERVRSDSASGARVLFRLYEIPDRAEGDRISVNTNSQSPVKPRDLRSNDKTMIGLKRAFEARYPDGFLLTKRGEERPADKDANKTIDVAIFAKALMAWECQRPNVSYNEKKLFDEHYKTLFRASYDPVSIQSLKGWLDAIDSAWDNLSMNDVLKAGKSYVRYHLLFSVSSLVSHSNGQPQSVVEPRFTATALERSNEILSLAATCLDNALNAAVTNAQASGRVFSPQNWFKRVESVQGQMLVAGTLAGMLSAMPNGPALKALLAAPATSFHPRWSAD